MTAVSPGVGWIPIEYGSDVLKKVTQTSAVEEFGQPVPMTSETKYTPRSGGMTAAVTAKSGSYTEDTGTLDQVLLTAQKFTGAVRIAEEDLNDSLPDIINTRMADWGTSYAKLFDNACLAVTAAQSGVTVPFASLYYQLTQADSGTGYSANANLTQTGTGGTTYDKLSVAVGVVETGDYWDDGDALVVAHPSFKKKLRGIKDSQNRPIFQESASGIPGGATGHTTATLFGYPLRWSLGARTSAVATPTPAGNPLLIICNRMFMLRGVRSGPEYFNIDGNVGLGALTDETIIKMRSRRAFQIGHENAFSVLEDTTGV